MIKGTHNASQDRKWQRLTIITLGLTTLVFLCYLAAFISPTLLSGFFPTQKTEPTPVVALQMPTPRPTATPSATIEPTWTRSATDTPLPTTPGRTPTPSRTQESTPTFPATWTPVQPSGTPPPTRSNYPFALKNNEIIYTQYFFSADCNWLGIAGLVLDKEGNPITGLPVVINGGGFENHVTYSGHAPAYGESGWEHFLDAKVKEGEFLIQLYSNQGRPISDQIVVRTFADCRKNLIMIILEQNWDEFVP